MDIHLWLLPLLTVAVIIFSYKLNKTHNENSSSALHEAYWWGGSFFAYGVIDYFLLGINSFS
jgi:hypothetical protein